jgi:hypothetical protein
VTRLTVDQPSGVMPNGKRRPNDVIGSLRGRVRRAPTAVQERATGLVLALEDTRGIDESIRTLIVSRIPKDMPDELIARMSLVTMRVGDGLRDDLYDLFTIYLNAAIAAERRKGPPEYRCVRCADGIRGNRQVPGEGWLCRTCIEARERVLAGASNITERGD